MPKYYLWEDPFSYTVVAFDFHFIFFQVMLRFVKFMKVINYYFKFPHLSKINQIDIFIIKNPFCNDPSFIFFLDFWPLTNSSTQYRHN